MMATPSPRPVMSFEQAMENAMEKIKLRDPGLPNKYNVEVFLQLPFEGQSSYTSSYPAPTIQETRSAGAPTGPSASPARTPTTLPFEGQSRYKEDYKVPTPSAASPDRSLGPGGSPFASTPPASRIPFEGESHSKSVYKAPPPEYYPPPGTGTGTPGRPGPGTPSIKFEGQSKYKEDYQPHPIEKITQGKGDASLLASPARPALAPDTRDFMTASKLAYAARPPAVQIEEHEGRLRVILNRDATVQDLQLALEERTAIPVEAQSLVRHQDGSTLSDKPQASLVDALDWKSGEHLTLVNQYK